MTEQNKKLISPVLPGGTIGILGGGQLGRMLSIAAAQLGLRTHILSPEEETPASHCAYRTTIADYTDKDALVSFSNAVDAITFEFENVPVEALEKLIELGKPVAPGPKALAVSQDRLHEKNFINEIGACTAPYEPVDDLETLTRALNKIGSRSILKTRRFGYDGKGQTQIDAKEEDLPHAWEQAKAHAWAELGQSPSILEGFVEYDFELSVIACRGRNGDIRCYEPPRNFHKGGILRSSKAPSKAPKELIEKAIAVTSSILTELEYIGVMGVEFFALSDGEILVNEFAPRVHNSGHWTLDACSVSQFEQHIRAVAGWPLGDPLMHSAATMENLLGEDVNEWKKLAELPDTCLHIYGKGDARPGRKMGHVTRLKKIKKAKKE